MAKRNDPIINVILWVTSIRFVITGTKIRPIKSINDSTDMQVETSIIVISRSSLKNRGKNVLKDMLVV